MVHKSKLFGIFAKVKRISEQESPQASKKFKSEVQLQSEITSQLSKSGCTPVANSFFPKQTANIQLDGNGICGDWQQLPSRASMASCDKTSCGISNMRFVYGFATEEAFKSRRSAFSEHLKSSTHGSQLNKFRMKVALAQGAPLPKQSGQIIGYLTPIDPYTEAVLKRRIRTAHKVEKKNQPIDAYEADIELQQLNGLDMGNQHLKEHGFHICSSLIAAYERKSRSVRLGKSRYFGILSDGSPGKHDKVEHENVQMRFVDKETGIPEKALMLWSTKIMKG